mmetsp:Transcript_8939/g.17994  ORF Transcript_8939/g.17994 Transcript_8939/m.17994 type:complete len:100 (+) Transcript_8939:1595-1894(+)
MLLDVSCEMQDGTIIRISSLSMADLHPFHLVDHQPEVVIILFQKVPMAEFNQIHSETEDATVVTQPRCLTLSTFLPASIKFRVRSRVDGGLTRSSPGYS